MELERQGQQTLLAFMKKNERCFKSVLPKHLNQERWAWLIVNSIRQTPALAGVTPMSFINSIMLASNLGLEIRKNSCYLIPYGKECQLIVDYHGKMDLARRAGVGAIHVELVRDGDEFDYGFNASGLQFNWKPKQDVGEVIAGFCSSRVNGEHQVNIMYLSEIEAIRRRAKSGRSNLSLEQIRSIDIESLGFKDPNRTPWVTDWDRMARKTLIHRASNDWPMSVAMLTSHEIDTATDMGSPMPIAEGLEGAMLEIDPADNRPMVDGGGDTYDDQRESAKLAGQEELRKAEARRNGPPISKGQADRLLAAAKAAGISQERMKEILARHWSTSVTDVRQSDFDSVLAMIESSQA